MTLGARPSTAEGVGRDSLSAPRDVGAAERRVVVVTGLSGAGKASILRMLEDLGYEAVDNPPVPLLGELLGRAGGMSGAGLAVGIDARTRGFEAGQVIAALTALPRETGARPELIYAWADDAVLQRRFSETRRRHPLARTGRVQDGIDAERVLTAPLREAADLVLDTSDLPLPELRRLIAARYAARPPDGRSGLAVTLVSFAFPAGLPRESDMVFDVRFLRNPYYVAALRHLTGLDPAVGDYVEGDADFAGYFGRLRDFVDYMLPRAAAEGKHHVTVAVGCTGGRHRSVHVVNRLARELAAQGWWVTLMHRELSRSGAIDLPPAAVGAARQEMEEV